MAAIRSATTVVASTLCPEIRLHSNPDFEAVWAQLSAVSDAVNPNPPYWAHPWPGGQALARYILDNPAVTRGRRVLDIGSGSGICAIAAAIAGAAAIEAIDTDPWAVDAMTINARLNRVKLIVRAIDFSHAGDTEDVVLAGDLWYERFFARSITTHLLGLARRGKTVLMGDCGRAHFPRDQVQCLAVYPLTASPIFDAAGPVAGRVFSMLR